MVSLSDQVGQASNLLGLLLALDTLFTASQAQSLAAERGREGGARTTRLRTIRASSIGLTVVTVAGILSLSPLFVDVLGAIGGKGWTPVLGVFDLTWLLLVSLAVWQVMIARSTGRGR